MSRIGFIGTGHIAAPMVRRMVGLGHEVIVTSRNADVAAALAQSHGVSVDEPKAVLDASDIIFICLRPSVAPDILTTLSFRPDHQIISVMAEHSEATLRQICAPAKHITRTIPFGFVEQGGCPLPVWGDVALVTKLFGPDNLILAMPQEAGLNAVLAASAIMANQLDMLQTIAAWTEAQLGDADVADAYVRHLVNGFLTTMPQHAGALAQERDALTLPGSLNHALMHKMRDAGTHEALTQALDDVYERLTSQ